jgi:hypothetical protein
VKLACDEMLKGLGRWLRAAGHDTLVASRGMTDADLLGLCRAEDRILLTRDRRLAGQGGDVRVLRLESDAPDEQAKALREALDLDWRAAPFTRCMMDNATLVEADAEAFARMPPTAAALPGPHRLCPVCSRVYWPGSHVRRIQAQLDAWAGLSR